MINANNDSDAALREQPHPHNAASGPGADSDANPNRREPPPRRFDYSAVFQRGREYLTRFNIVIEAIMIMLLFSDVAICTVTLPSATGPNQRSAAAATVCAFSEGHAGAVDCNDLASFVSEDDVVEFVFNPAVCFAYYYLLVKILRCVTPNYYRFHQIITLGFYPEPSPEEHILQPDQSEPALQYLAMDWGKGMWLLWIMSTYAKYVLHATNKQSTFGLAFNGPNTCEAFEANAWPVALPFFLSLSLARLSQFHNLVPMSTTVSSMYGGRLFSWWVVTHMIVSAGTVITFLAYGTASLQQGKLLGYVTGAIHLAILTSFRVHPLQLRDGMVLAAKKVSTFPVLKNYYDEAFQENIAQMAQLFETRAAVLFCALTFAVCEAIICLPIVFATLYMAPHEMFPTANPEDGSLVLLLQCARLLFHLCLAVGWCFVFALLATWAIPPPHKDYYVMISSVKHPKTLKSLLSDDADDLSRNIAHYLDIAGIAFSDFLLNMTTSPNNPGRYFAVHYQYPQIFNLHEYGISLYSPRGLCVQLQRWCLNHDMHNKLMPFVSDQFASVEFGHAVMRYLDFLEHSDGLCRAGAAAPLTKSYLEPYTSLKEVFEVFHRRSLVMHVKLFKGNPQMHLPPQNTDFFLKLMSFYRWSTPMSTAFLSSAGGSPVRKLIERLCRALEHMPQSSSYTVGSETALYPLPSAMWPYVQLNTDESAVAFTISQLSCLLETVRNAALEGNVAVFRQLLQKEVFRSSLLRAVFWGEGRTGKLRRGQVFVFMGNRFALQPPPQPNPVVDEWMTLRSLAAHTLHILIRSDVTPKVARARELDLRAYITKDEVASLIYCVANRIRGCFAPPHFLSQVVSVIAILLSRRGSMFFTDGEYLTMFQKYKRWNQPGLYFIRVGPSPDAVIPTSHPHAQAQFPVFNPGRIVPPLDLLDIDALPPQMSGSAIEASDNELLNTLISLINHSDAITVPLISVYSSLVTRCFGEAIIRYPVVSYLSVPGQAMQPPTEGRGVAQLGRTVMLMLTQVINFCVGCQRTMISQCRQQATGNSLLASDMATSDVSLEQDGDLMERFAKATSAEDHEGVRLFVVGYVEGLELLLHMGRISLNQTLPANPPASSEAQRAPIDVVLGSEAIVMHLLSRLKTVGKRSPVNARDVREANAPADIAGHLSLIDTPAFANPARTDGFTARGVLADWTRRCDSVAVGVVERLLDSFAESSSRFLEVTDDFNANVGDDEDGEHHPECAICLEEIYPADHHIHGNGSRGPMDSGSTQWGSDSLASEASSYASNESTQIDPNSWAAESARRITTTENSIVSMLASLHRLEKEGVTVRKCRHSFHKMCMLVWALNHTTCPTCRQEI